MIWQDNGQIFSTKEYGISFAKSPQALVFDDFIRIYFSACKPDGAKLISYVCYIDYNIKQNKVLNFSDKVIDDGLLGCFDEHGIFPFSPVRIDNEIFAYTSGMSRRVSVSVDTGIGLAVSKDNGKTFKRMGNGPVLTSSLHEPFLVMDGFVKKYDNTLHMWYIFGEKWKIFEGNAYPERVYKIGHAMSNDGINWQKTNKQIIKSKYEDEAQALPTVAKFNDKYHMMFCTRDANDFRTNHARSYKLGYATSNDLKNWQRNDSLAFASSGKWASEMACYPNLFEFEKKLYLLYNGNEFGKHGFGLAQLK